MSKTEGSKRAPRRDDVAKPVDTGRRMLDVRDVCNLLRCSVRTLERMVEADEFPKPIMLREDSRRSSRRWTLDQYERWAGRRQKDAESQVA